MDHLPDEVLEIVLLHIPLSQMRQEERLSCLLVCKKWASILEPMLFHKIYLLYNHRGGGARTSQLLNFFNVKPHLSRYVQLISLEIMKTDDWIYTRVMQILDLCPSVQSFSLCARLQDKQLPHLYNKAVAEKYKSLVTRLAAINLKSLQLDMFPYEIMFEALAGHNLQSLELRDSSNTRHDDQDLVEHNLPTVGTYRDSIITQQLHPRFFRSGSVRELSLTNSMLNCVPMVLLLQWPAKLEVFSMKGAELIEIPTYHDIDYLLDCHRETLTTLTFGPVFVTSGGRYETRVSLPTLDLGCFPKLTRLSLNFENALDAKALEVTSLSRSSIVCRNYLSPNLKYLEVVLNERRWEKELPYWSYIRALRAWFTWVHSVITINQKGKDQDTCCALEKICIREAIELQDCAPESLKSMDWPHDFLNAAQRLMAEVGVQVVYIGSQLSMDLSQIFDDIESA